MKGYIVSGKMARISSDPLQPNPFITYRDPKTGTWLVIKSGQEVETTVGKTSEFDRTHQMSEPSSALGHER
jgi:hypothetical protein